MFLIQHSKSSAVHTGQIICTMPGNCRHGTRCVLRRASNHWVTSLSYAVVMFCRRTQSLGVSSVAGRVIQHYSPPGLLPPSSVTHESLTHPVMAGGSKLALNLQFQFGYSTAQSSEYIMASPAVSDLWITPFLTLSVCFFCHSEIVLIVLCNTYLCAHCFVAFAQKQPNVVHLSSLIYFTCLLTCRWNVVCLKMMALPTSGANVGCP